MFFKKASGAKIKCFAPFAALVTGQWRTEDGIDTVCKLEDEKLTYTVAIFT